MFAAILFLLGLLPMVKQRLVRVVGSNIQNTCVLCWKLKFVLQHCQTSVSINCKQHPFTHSPISPCEKKCVNLILICKFKITASCSVEIQWHLLEPIPSPRPNVPLLYLWIPFTLRDTSHLKTPEFCIIP